MATTTNDAALRVIGQLTPEEQRRLREQLAAAEVSAGPVPEVSAGPVPRESLYGIAAHLGSAPSAEEIDE